MAAALAMALLTWLCVGSPAVFSAPPEQQAPTNTPVRSPTGTSAAPRPLATRTDKPLTGLVLVPLSVKVGPPTPGNAADLTAIRGYVTDYNGQGLRGQVVKITRGQASQTATTDDRGFFEIDGLVPGTYSVTVEAQICTPAENLKAEANTGLEVEFGQIRPAATVVAATRTPTSAAATPTRTPLPAAVTPTATPAPRPTATPASVARWWSWLGIEIDISALGSSLFLGVMGGALLFAIGIVVGLIRR